MRTLARIAVAAILLLLLLAARLGKIMSGAILHPRPRPLTQESVTEADAVFKRVGAMREDFEVHAPDGILLRGWKLRPVPPRSSRHEGGAPTNDWVLLYHGVSDNRVGVLGHAELLLRNGYGVLMMDARAHGASEGSMATYGWKERYDTQAIVHALYKSEPVHCLLALGESMGAALALQSAAVEPRISGVVAESSFSNLREASYDYAVLHLSSWLGRTLFRPAAYMGIRRAEKDGGFKAEDVSAEKAVGQRSFPILLICGTRDHTIPRRHSERILRAAKGPSRLWLVPRAGHSAVLGAAPAEFEQRVLSFYTEIHIRK